MHVSPHLVNSFVATVIKEFYLENREQARTRQKIAERRAAKAGTKTAESNAGVA